MLLAKSCQKKYHINNGVLKLGTLYEYRNIENAELVDKHEGMLSFHLNFHGRVSISSQWFNTISGGAIGLGEGEPISFPGRTSAYFENLQLENLSKQSMILVDSSAVISRESLNSFIFCMSLVRRTTECVGIFSGYDAYWYLPEARAGVFAMELGDLLLSHIKNQHRSGSYVLPPETDLESLEFAIECRAVDYVSREVHLYDGDFITLERFFRTMQNMAFTKPDSYVNEREYRFNFVAISEGKVVEPIVDSVLLSSESLQKYIF